MLCMPQWRSHRQVFTRWSPRYFTAVGVGHCCHENIYLMNTQSTTGMLLKMRKSFALFTNNMSNIVDNSPLQLKSGHSCLETIRVKRVMRSRNATPWTKVTLPSIDTYPNWMPRGVPTYICVCFSHRRTHSLHNST